VLSPLKLQGKIDLLGVKGMIGAKLLKELAITRAALVRRHNAEHRLILCANALQTESNHTKSVVLPG
jgi:hypothetical protein